MSEDINLITMMTGTLLTFPRAEFYGLPGFRLETLTNLDDSYVVERPTYSFQVSTLEVFENDVKEDDTFTVDDVAHTYTFKVSKTPVPDLTGWSRIDATFIGRVVL